MAFVKTDYSKRLTIFEGPDGSGKTTLASAYALATGAQYVHLGPFLDIKDGPELARQYVAAMMPVIKGVYNVVMDRSWISEKPYGLTFRRGADRIGYLQRSLERLALRCRVSVVHCQTDLPRTEKNFLGRPEYLDRLDQLFEVYEWYSYLLKSHTNLPVLHIDPFKRGETSANVQYLMEKLCDVETSPHPLHQATAGNLLGKVVLVGEKFANKPSCDPEYSWPFGSFSTVGCSQWLSTGIANADISERDLFWVNADEVLPENVYGRNVIALGGTATNKLTEFDVGHKIVHHPAYWKRFAHSQPYPLYDMIKEMIKKEDRNASKLSPGFIGSPCYYEEQS